MSSSRHLMLIAVTLWAAASGAGAVTFSVQSVRADGATVRFEQPAPGPITAAPLPPILFAFTSTPTVTPRVMVHSDNAARSAIPVTLTTAGWAGRDYLQWIAISPPFKTGHPMATSGTIEIAFPSPVVDTRKPGAAVLRGSILHLAMTSGLPKSTVASLPPLPYHSGVKISVDADGLYQIDARSLKALGVRVSSIVSRTLRLYERERELPIYITNAHRASMQDDDQILFYGRKLRNANGTLTQYSNTNVYWLTWEGGSGGLRVAEAFGTVRVDPTRYRQQQADTIDLEAREFRDTLHLETDAALQWLGSTDQPEEMGQAPSEEQSIDNWYWGSVGDRELTDYSISIPSPAAKGYARMRIGFMGLTRSDADPLDHQVQILLNSDRPLVNRDMVATWDGQKPFVYESEEFGVAQLLPGINTITFRTPARGYADRSALNWIEIDYPRRFETLDGTLVFHTNPADVNALKQFTLSGFPKSDIDLWDITSHRVLRNFRVAEQKTESGARAYTLLFQDSVSTITTFVAQTQELRRAPADMRLDTIVDNTGSYPGGVDYVMVTASRFMGAFKPLADLYRGRGLIVATIDIDDIYNRFTYGIRNPEAIRDLLSYIFATCGGRSPRYLLLGGDTSHDLDKVTGTAGSNVVPTHIARAPGWGPCSDDGYFATVVGDDFLPDLFVGRFPAGSPDQLATMVTKTVRYLQGLEKGPWHDNIVLASGYEPSFTQFSNEASAQVIGPRMNVIRIDAEPGSPWFHTGSAAIRRMADAINAGAYAVNFNGHGGGNVWSDSRLFSYADLPLLHNEQWTAGGRLPFVFSFTCLTGFFESVYYQSLGEEFLRFGPGGAVGFYGASAYTSREGNMIMNRLLLEDAVSDDSTSIGELLWLAEMKMLVLDEYRWLPLVRQYNYLGDPALPWHLAPDSLNVSLDANALSAGDSLGVHLSCAPVSTGSVKARISSGVSTLYDRVSTLTAGDLDMSVAMKDSLIVTDGMVRAYAWNATAEVRGWKAFSKDRVQVSDVRLTNPEPRFGDTVRVQCQIASPSGAPAPLVRCLYVIAQPFGNAAGFGGSADVGMHADSTSGYWTTNTPVTLTFSRTPATALLVKFRVSGMLGESSVFSFPIRGTPDLRFSGMRPAIVWFNDSLCATFEVLNAGNQAAPSFDATVFWGDPSEGHIAATMRFTDSLPAGTTTLLRCAIPDTSGALTWSVVINPAARFEEIETGNNAASSSVRLSYEDVQETTDTLFSLRRGVAVVPSTAFAGLRRVFLMQDTISAPTPLSTASHWASVEGDSVCQFRVAARPALLDSDRLNWVFRLAAPESLLAKKTAVDASRAAVMTFDTTLSSWVYAGAATLDVRQRLLVTSSPRHGPFAAAALSDCRPPVIGLSVAGRRFSELDYAAKGKPFDLFLSDPSGLLPGSIFARLNGRELGSTYITAPPATGDMRNVRLTAYPPKERTVDSLTIGATDFAGNDTVATFAYMPGEALAIKFVACHPSPFTARQDARGETIQTIKLAYLLTDVADKVTITIYTISGKRVRTWVSHDVIGYQEIAWDGKSQNGYRIANGTYYLKVVAKNDRKNVRKIIKIAKLEGY